MTTVTLSRPREAAQVSVSTRMGIGVGLGALTLAMLILAFPPFNVWPLAFFCLVPMLVAQYRVLPLRWSALGSIIGGDLWVLWFVTLLFGLRPETLFIQLIPVLCAVKDIFTVPASRRFHEGTRYRWFVAEGAFGWVGFEMIRRFIPLIRTHGYIGHTLHTQPWLIQPVSITGIYGLSLLIVFVNYALAQAAFALLDARWPSGDAPAVGRRLYRRWLAGVGIALAAWIALSLVLLAAAPRDAPTIRVAAVQHGYLAAGHVDRDTPQEVRLQGLAEQTRAAAQQGAQLVVWPELGLGFNPQVEHTAELRALAAETNAYLVIGYGRATETESRNAAVVLTPAGEFLAVSGKSHPSPGEPLDPAAGAYPVYDIPLGRLGVIICNDANFTDSSRILARKGAQLIAVPTLETYIPGLEKFFIIQTLFRAVENRVTTVKADVAYSSAIVDPYGRILARRSGAPEGSAFALLADVPLGTGNTFFSRVGDWVGWLSLAGFAFFIFLPEVIKRRQTREAKHAAR
jgi:apolipoprotein N-acyltransferase